MLPLLIIFAIALLAWGNALTVRLLKRRTASAGWWTVLYFLWVAGVCLGIYGGFYLEYHASPTLRVVGAPVPAAFFHWEGPPGQESWVDFITEAPLINAAANVLLMPLLLACPMGPVFWSWRKFCSSAK